MKKRQKYIEVICGWCKIPFITTNQQREYGYGTRVCSNCGRTVNASRKESTGNIVGRKHTHSDSKTGDIV